MLLLQQLFGQGEKWHLNLDTDLSELENRFEENEPFLFMKLFHCRDLLDAVRKWEEDELSGAKVLIKTLN